MQIVPASELIEIAKGYEGFREHRNDSWYAHSTYKNNGFGAIPMAVSHLYRGQNTRYVPLLPSIARGLNTNDLAQLWMGDISDQAKVIIRLAQSWWFARELNHHPVMQHSKKVRFGLDEIAMAQHYGIDTGYLDLTDDFNVSAFFATCRCLSDGSWEPVDSGIGVVYRVSLRDDKSCFEKYMPLGPQKLPRPTEQSAWVVELPMHHSFEGWPGVSMLQFEHDRSVGEYFLDKFAGGKVLFPADPLADVADEILSCGELPVELFEAAFDSFASDPLGIRPDQISAIRNEALKIVALTRYRRLLTPEAVSLLTSDADWCDRMLGSVNVKVCAVRSVMVGE
ncbi:MAG TPA: FRG domain-containing protein [Cellvibrio sp.]|nr:FRG domain-containing protein [Cellvibrio sp.]